MKSKRKNQFHFGILVLGLCVLCQNQATSQKLEIVDTILEDASSFFYLGKDCFDPLDQTLPIGVFDSGTGGLTVLDAILKLDVYDNQTQARKETGDGRRDLEKEEFIYLADQANMPYGNYAGQNNTAMLRENIIKDVQFLLGEKYYRHGKAKNHAGDKSPVKAIVIGCNTATAYGKGDVESFLDQAGLDVRVIGVIDAGANAALNTFQKKEDGIIGVFATAGTVASQGYVNTLHTIRNRLNYSGDIAVYQQAGIGLASAIDGIPGYIAPLARKPQANYQGPAIGHSDPQARIDPTILQRYGLDWQENHILYSGPRETPDTVQLNSVRNQIAFHVVTLMEKIRQAKESKKLKAVILGCTHYPYFAEEFKRRFTVLYHYREKGQYLYRPYLEEEIAIVDPAENTAKELYTYLKAKRLFNRSDCRNSEFYISVPNPDNENIALEAEGQFTLEYKYGRRVGDIQEYVKRVPFSKRNISEATLARLRNKLPFIYDLICDFHGGNEKTDDLATPYKIAPPGMP